MVDERFYRSFGPLSVAALAEGRDVRGDPTAQIATVAPVASCAAGALSYFGGRADKATPVAGGCVIVGPALADAGVLGAEAWIVDPAPRSAFARIAVRLHKPRSPLDEGPTLIEAGARIAPSAVIAAGAEVGAGAEIGPYAVIGPGCAIGRGSQIGAHASVMCALVGDDVSIGAHATIGGDGFGVAGDAGGLVSVPHLGRVIIQDRVRIGAATTVDRGMLDDTVIGEETKIDNLCQIAHNVKIGRQVVMAAFAGVSGSSVIGDRARFGGRVGVADHVTIGADASLAAGAAVMHDVPAGETWGGYPAKPFRAWMREIAWLKRAIGRPHGGG